jgi:AcrR family transcriptional regulator
LNFFINLQNLKMTSSTDKAARLKAQIVNAAKIRFLAAPVTKTTLAEIAADCDISPPHIYNFFQSKLDVAVAVFGRISSEQGEILARSLVSHDPVSKNLRRYFQAELLDNYNALKLHKGLAVLERTVRQQRKLAAENFRIRRLKPLSLYLDQAMRRGEIIPKDPFWMAEAFHVITSSFRHLDFPMSKTHEELERQLEGVLDLLLDGILIKKMSPAGKAGDKV